MKNIRVMLAIVVMIGVVAWVYSSTQSTSYSGENISFPMPGGPVVINNTGDEALPVRIQGTGTRGNFTLSSSDANIPRASAREGTGSNSLHFVEFEAQPGTTEVQLVRGTTITMTITGNAEVTAAAQSANSIQTTLLIGAVVLLAALFYISNTTEHAWIGWVRRQFNKSNIGLAKEDAPSAS